LIGSSSSNEIDVIAKPMDGEWVAWERLDGMDIAFPLAPDGMSDSVPLGMALDFTCNENLPPLTPDLPPLPPAPILLCLTDQGEIMGFNCVHLTPEGEGNPCGMIQTTETVPTSSTVPQSTPSISSNQTVTAIPTPPKPNESVAPQPSFKEIPKQPISIASTIKPITTFPSSLSSTVPTSSLITTPELSKLKTSTPIPQNKTKMETLPKEALVNITPKTTPTPKKSTAADTQVINSS